MVTEIMSHSTETTRLLTRIHQPDYVYNAQLGTERKRRVRQFQCCLCALFLTTLLVALIATISLSINNTNTSELNNTALPLDSFLVLFSNNWPIADKEYIHHFSDEFDVKESMDVEVPAIGIKKVVATSEKARDLSRIGYVQEYALRHIINRSLNRSSNYYKICNNYSTPSIPLACDNDHLECNRFKKYRSYDGTCNNLKHSNTYGTAYKPFRRALLPDYADGISKPRVAKDGKPLPSARTVSLMVHRPYYKEDTKFSVMLAVWGQFLDHDITATALAQKSNSDTISCCGSSTVQFPECYPVELDPRDPFMEYNVSCMEFLRSAPAPTCCLCPREQMNQVTSYIDGSVVYGVDESLIDNLRDFQNGTLKMYITKDGRTLLPVSNDLKDGCNREEEKNNEKILFSYRRILSAQMQHITYNEFLPILLGNKLMKRFNLVPQKTGYFLKYNETVNPNIANNFATAAFRFAHSIIPGVMKMLANDTSSPEFVQMHKMLFNPFKLYDPGELDKTLRGAVNTAIESSDSYFSNEIKSHLFEITAEQVKQPKLCGLDLVSLNIQRGRDHGLPGYSLWRKHCSLKIPKQFDDLKNEMDGEALKNIKNIYRNVDDVDLYTGALSERPLAESMLGPTLTCLILDQFVRIKYGDRFWYENPHRPQGFAPEQLDEIRKTTLASVICDNADDLNVIQSKVMEGLHSGNEYVPCASIERPNIGLWGEILDHSILSSSLTKILSFRKLVTS
ncbi:hypothetical protein NQ317_009923 [Molorchus minor]|uniref:Chorion peroxidase n=1 Tax=Molorchus minor TaxID=1323400 RepID=A0ABQ9K880_9CUCU|nr:hypothetical protein NQ317_009923 [Molorchus minor]